MTNHLPVTGHFVSRAPNDHKMILNTTGTKVPHICDSSFTVTNANPFRAMASRFQATGHFEMSAPNDCKWPWILKGQRHTIYVLLEHSSHECQSVSLYGEPFSSYRSF